MPTPGRAARPAHPLLVAVLLLVTHAPCRGGSPDSCEAGSGNQAACSGARGDAWSVTGSILSWSPEELLDDTQVAAHLERACSPAAGGCGSGGAPRFTTHLAAPLVRVYDGVLTASEAKHFIEVSAPKMEDSAQVASRNAARGGTSTGRSNQRYWLRRSHDATVRGVVDRIARIVGIDASHAEGPQVISYGPGQEYKGHYDAFNMSSPNGRNATYTGQGGQRMLTALAYLTKVESGGSTCFAKLRPQEGGPLCVAPDVGRLLVFSNCDPPTSPTRSPMSFHAAQPVQAGVKWAFNLWFRRDRRP